jgi:hypothetical protein
VWICSNLVVDNDMEVSMTESTGSDRDVHKAPAPHVASWGSWLTEDMVLEGTGLSTYVLVKRCVYPNCVEKVERR